MTSSSMAMQMPFDHIMWGENGPAGNHMIKRATTSSASTATILSGSVVPASSSSASPTTPASGSSTTSKAPDSACTNSPLTRSCWGNGFSIATDFDKKWPNTGKTVSYNIEVTNTTCNPDGNGSKLCFLFNNQYPGPTIRANWGDMISVTVKNSLQNNGTSIHWHGIRQLGTTSQDGVNGITECPLAPGDTKTYLFQATQFGTSWYHSHYSAQYGDGLIGQIIIDGPATANYDIDLGAYPINEWYHNNTAFQLEDIANQNLQNHQGPPVPDTILVNGKNKNSAGAGAYDVQTITKGKKYRLRLINSSVDSQIRVSLDNHPFTVITSDFVPIKPFTTNWILLAIGQRYDVVFTANQAPGNYWFRAEVAADCASANSFYGRSVFTYSTVTSATPATTSTTPDSVCQPESVIVPYVSNMVPNTTFLSQVKDLEVDIDQVQVTTNGQNIAVWGINLTAIDIDWRDPTLEYVITGNTSYPQTYNLIEIPDEGTWTYWIIQETAGTPAPIPHPIHLHGHDFYVLGNGTGVFDKAVDTPNLNFVNPTRRDVTFLPGGGWLVIAFPADNPGAWLMHCHIAWHVSEGLGVQFLESKNTIPLPDANWNKTCTNWANYYNGNPVYLKDDSGL
ncbi:multicopper oxidase [Viridothelium virens]|uniref:laccase n=1 Tax=Viridothelium virens TaxID=1048519 RepID=A0A6A6GZC7_VIRVR|nr:multicopper oxidase [Viridothelium virens]